MSRNLIQLPNEILFTIISLLSPLDIPRVRDVCRKTRNMCNKPYYWRNLVLDVSKDERSLWNLKELKDILDPHRQWIESVHIRGVRDSIMQYLLLECPELKELTVCGWATLSDHSFGLEKKKGIFKIQRLKLVGDSEQKSNFISLDSVTLGQWIGQCPYLEELSINCKVHLYAEDLVRSIQTVSPLALKSIVIATKNTWSSQHVAQLFRHCAQLQFLRLIPDSASLGYSATS
ncbi:unnamed protein product [Rhizopus stolonifer]